MLKSFIIGSSFPVFFIFFASLYFRDPKSYNYSYNLYSIVAPLYLGIMNVIATLMRKNLKLSLAQSLLITSIMAFAIITSFAYYNKVYDYNKEEWFYYFARQLIRYLFVFNVIIYYLTIYL